MIKVGVNLLWLVPDQVGGSEEYVMRLLHSVKDHKNEELKITLYGTANLFEKYPDLVESFECVSSPTDNKIRSWRIFLENTWLANASRENDFIHHAGGVVPTVRSSVPLVTIHDIQPIDLPSNFSPVKRSWLQRMIPHSIEVSRLVMTPSEFTKDRIIDKFSTSDKRIKVVSHGISELDLDNDYDAEQKYGKYLLYPAIAYPHKQHIDLLHAFKLLSLKFPDLNLVLTGSSGPLDEEVNTCILDLEIESNVFKLGRVDSSILNSLYSSAVAMVFPSSYEGFGNPVLEAMSLECPVVCSDIPALHEVAGDAALYFGVHNVEEIANQVEEIINNENLRAECISKGKSRSLQFSWDKSAKQLMDSYRYAKELEL